MAQNDQTPYAEKLRDPRWQKMRLQVMERDQWRCQICDDSTTTLAVHHRYYLRDTEPWEYPLEALVTLCEFCHGHETHERADAEKRLLETLRRVGLSTHHLVALACAVEMAHRWRLGSDQPEHLTLARLFAEPELLTIFETTHLVRQCEAKWPHAAEEYAQVLQAYSTRLESFKSPDRPR